MAAESESDPTNWRAIWTNPLARDYVFVGMIALIVVFVGMTLRGGMTSGLLAPLIASLGLVFRWSGMPLVFLVLLSYLLVFPYGLPIQPNGIAETTGHNFRITDLVLVGAVAVYFGCQYRLLSLTARAMPSDLMFDKSKHPPVRPAETMLEGELARLLWTVGGIVFAGQVAWFLLTTFTLDLREFPPLRLIPRPTFGMSETGFGISPPFARLVMVLGTLTFCLIAMRLVFWYWRLTRLTPEQARMVLLDTEWSESRRELNRQEKWRASRHPGGVFVKPSKRGQPDRTARRRRWRGIFLAGGTILLIVLLFRLFTVIRM